MQTSQFSKSTETSTAQTSQPVQTHNEPLPQTTQMSSKTYFDDMRQFLYNCRHDKRLTPATQLVYRTLIDLYNANYWSTPLIISDAELQEITHITSKQDITRVKRTLKNLNYIDFYGKPSHYTINRPPVQRQVQRQVQIGGMFNTVTPKHDFSERRNKQEERGADHERHDFSNDDPELDELINGK